MHASHPPAHRIATWWLAAIVGSVALFLATPAVSHAEESNPNNYNCLGQLSPGAPEEGSEETQVQYNFYCNGPITGYQIQTQVPMTGVQGSPTIVNVSASPLKDTFSCSGEFPGWALNCVGSAKTGYEFFTGEFAIGTKLCTEPRVDGLLTVSYAYLEKGVITQAISGPFDLGRPKGCPPDAFSGGTRLNPKPMIITPNKPANKSKRHKKAKKTSKKK